jgi:Response regulator containing a CheY-like receiver domain and an HTH DNA-binding domain
LDRSSVAQDVSQAIVKACHSGLPVDKLRVEVLTRLRRLLPADAVWWAAADPATLLFTNTYRAELPADSTGYFVENEFLHDDFNKWSELARDREGVRSLVQATGGSLGRSERYRDIFQPLGLGDELRTVLRIQGSTWGLLCLHSEAGRPYARNEVDWMRRLGPHLAEAMRVALLIQNLDAPEHDGAPGLVVLAANGPVIGITPAGEHWLEELSVQGDQRLPVPIEVQAVAVSLRSMGTGEHGAPRLRVRTKAGRWAVLHASWMHAAGEDAIAVIIEEAMPTELATVIMLAYGLTNQERVVTGLVSRGLSTADISAELHISMDTVQDHLKSVFHKTGVGSRTELVATILRQHYLPQAKAGHPVGAKGFFA